MLEPIGSVEEVYAHALAIESEAAKCYRRFQEHFADRGEEVLAGLCGNLAHFEEDHHRLLVERAGKLKLPELPPERYRWLESGPTEAVDCELVFRLATPRELLEIALKAERGAKRFFEWVAGTTAKRRDPRAGRGDGARGGRARAVGDPGDGVLLLTLSSRFQYLRHEEVHRRALLLLAGQTTQAVENSMHSEMLNRNLEGLQRTIDAIGDGEVIASIAILDPSGRVILSPGMKGVGQVLDNRDPTCQPCHRMSAEARPNSVIVDLPGHEAARADLGCDRRLVRRGEKWEVEAL